MPVNMCIRTELFSIISDCLLQSKPLRSITYDPTCKGQSNLSSGKGGPGLPSHLPCEAKGLSLQLGKPRP